MYRVGGIQKLSTIRNLLENNVDPYNFTQRLCAISFVSLLFDIDRDYKPSTLDATICVCCITSSTAVVASSIKNNPLLSPKLSLKIVSHFRWLESLWVSAVHWLHV
eukprot:NODE_253_length_12805_cov_0.273413.p7 type:complete len:106 gc:universal NODE_253_length_12805_cov_0.273413:11553-11870(+)